MGLYQINTFTFQAVNVLISSIDTDIDELHLQTISNIVIPTHHMETIPAKKTCTCMSKTSACHKMYL